MTTSPLNSTFPSTTTSLPKKRKAKGGLRKDTPKKENLECDLPFLPAEIWINAISFLQIRDLAQVSLVCWNFHGFSEEQSIWKSLFLNAFGRFYFDCVNKEFGGSWKKAYKLFLELAPFLKEISEQEMNSYLYNEKKIGRFLSSPSVFTCASNRDYSFALNETADAIEMKKVNSLKEERALFTFSIKEEEAVSDKITHLACDNQYLFAMTLNFRIFQWNIETGRLLQTQSSDLTNYLSPEKAFCHEFFIHNGSLIQIALPYLSIISSACPNQARSYKCAGDFRPGVLSRRPVVHQEKLYIMGWHSISVWDLKNQQLCDQITTQEHKSQFSYITAITLNEEKIYYILENQIFVYDPAKETHVLLKSFYESYYSAISIHFTENYFFCFCKSCTGEYRLDIFQKSDLTQLKEISLGTSTNFGPETIEKLIHQILETIPLKS